MAKELLQRSEVRMEDTWAIEDIYPTKEAWESDIQKARELAMEISGMQEQMAKSAGELLKILDLYMECERIMQQAVHYAKRASDVDTRNTGHQADLQRVLGIVADISSKLAFLEPKLLSLPKETLEEYQKEEPKLSLYHIWFQELYRKKEHTLSAEMEELLASAQEICQLPGQVFSLFQDADMEFPEITDENGEQVRITGGRYLSMQSSLDRRVRKDAFLGLYGTYQKFENTLAALYFGQVKQQMFLAKAKNYASTLQAAVYENNVPMKVYENLLETVNENLDKLHRYVGLRRKFLGLSELHMYDLYAPMVIDESRKVPYEKAKAAVVKSLEPLGESYVEVVKQGFENRWIDVYENKGKRGGAYSAGLYGVHPFVLLNYDEKLGDMFTLAHEMGHAMHSYLSGKHQPFLYSRYKTFLAEVASTCNEVLLMEYFLAHTKDENERACLINHFLDKFRGTLYRQTMFAEYEKITNEMAEAGESLTADVLKQVYYGLNRKYYGPDMVSDEEIAWEWCRIPHFYYRFYVYQYATGFSAAVAIARRILKEGTPAVEDYLRFLSSGCLDAPLALLRTAGVDLETKEPIQAALEVFEELLDEMEMYVSKYNGS